MILALFGLDPLSTSVLVSSAMFVASAVVGFLLRPKVKKQSPHDPYGWGTQTIQRPDVPMEVVIGRMPVEGNLFAPWTEVTNTTETIDKIILAAFKLSGKDVRFPVSLNPVVRTSRHVLHCCLAFCGHSVKGLVAGESYLNDKLTTDWTGVTAIERLGTDIQTASATAERFEMPHQEKVVVGTPITIAVKDANYDRLALILGSPEGLVCYDTADGGDERAQYFRTKVEIRAVAGAWHTLFDYYLWGRIADPVRWVLYSDGTYTGGTAFTITPGVNHEFRVTLVEGTIAPVAQGTLYVLGVQEIYDTVAYRFPGLVYLRLSTISMEGLSDTLRFRGLLDGAILESADGHTIAWSDNPARAMRFIICLPVVKGDGVGTPYTIDYYRGDDPAWIDEAELVAAEAWCDVLRDDGKGGTEKQFRFDGRFSDTAERWEQVQRIGKMCRVVPWHDGRRWRFYIDRPTTVAQIFCDENSEAYREGSPDPRKAPGVIKGEIKYIDADYADTPIKYVDPLGTTKNIERIDAFGITRASQFTRQGRYFCDRARYIDLVNSWESGPSGMDAETGQVAYVQSDTNGRQVGGLVVRVLDTQTLRVNRDLPAAAGVTYQFALQTLDDDGKHVVTYTVDSLLDARTVRLTAALTYTPLADDVWICGATLDSFRITGHQWTGQGRCTFTGERYTADIFARDAAALDMDSTVYVARAKPSRSTPKPLTREDLLTAYPQDRIHSLPNQMAVQWGGITFAAAGGAEVSWVCTGDHDLGWVQLGGVFYPIQHGPAVLEDAAGEPLEDASGGLLEDAYSNVTTEEYIYFDRDAADPSRLLTTSDASLLRGESGRVPLCRNLAGVPHLLTGGRLGTNTQDLYPNTVTAPGGSCNEMILFLGVAAGVEIHRVSGFVTTGQEVEIEWGARLWSWSISGDGAVVTLSLYCDGGSALATIAAVPTTTGDIRRQFKTTRHTPAAGSHEYTVVATIAVTTPVQLYANCGERTIYLREIKR
jgi:hypothetical protein